MKHKLAILMIGIISILTIGKVGATELDCSHSGIQLDPQSNNRVCILIAPIPKDIPMGSTIHINYELTGGTSLIQSIWSDQTIGSFKLDSPTTYGQTGTMTIRVISTLMDAEEKHLAYLTIYFPEREKNYNFTIKDAAVRLPSNELRSLPNIDGTYIISNPAYVPTTPSGNTGNTGSSGNQTETSTSQKVEIIGEHIDLVDIATLNDIKNDKKKVIYNRTENGKVKYSWTFDGSKMTNEDMGFSVDLGITIGTSKNQKTIESLLNNKNQSLVLQFDHQGKLPKGTTVSIDVSDKFKDGSKLKLLYYNETTKKLEEKLTNLIVKNGKVEIPLEHCSEYVLTQMMDSVIANNPNTKDPIIFYVGIATLLLGSIVVAKKKLATL